MNKLIHEARLPNTGFAHRCHNVAMARACLFQSLIEGVDFRVSSDKFGQPS
jgi:hypothetical protein